MEKFLLDLFSDKTEFQDLSESLESGCSLIQVVGLSEEQKVHTSSYIQTNCRRNIIYIAKTEEEAEKVYQEFLTYTNRVYLLHRDELNFFSIAAKDRSRETSNIAALNALAQRKFDVLVVTLTSLMRKYMPMERWKEFPLHLESEQSYGLQEISQKLLEMGYEREHKVEGIGQFSIRGDRLDIYTPSAKQPYRCIFFGDELEEIRSFDPFTQKSVESHRSISILPARSLLYPPNIVRLENLEVPEDVGDEIREDLIRLEERSYFENLPKYIDLLYPDRDLSLFSYLSRDDIFVGTDLKETSERLEAHYFDLKEEFLASLEKKTSLSLQGNLFYPTDLTMERYLAQTCIVHTYFLKQMTPFRPERIVNFETKQATVFYGNVTEFLEELRFLISKHYRIVLTYIEKEMYFSFAKMLTEAGLSFQEAKDSVYGVPSIVLMQSSFKKGFLYTAAGVAIYSERDVFQKSTMTTKRKRKHREKTKAIEHFIDLKKGDTVVHETYGIGRFVDIEQRDSKKGKRDFIKLLYHGNDMLYVPLEQMNKIQKYIGDQSGDRARLSKLGTDAWKKSKARTKKSVETIAKDIVELYAKRQQEKGYAFAPDTAWQREFENGFPYEETTDQILAIEDVKRDMEETKMMERLLCGDVGYGKTEVAIRAIFKACMEPKQAVFLVPTTILAQQHGKTLKERFAEYPIRVEVLSRFRKKSDVTRVLKDLSKGLVDVVIGTHRLLSEDVTFYDLGLLVIDEEQRFGVRDKEKIKKWKRNVDVLSLSATPIPRTLHLSLSGIRDMSMLKEAPSSRRPILTYVTEAQDGIIVNAIERERMRNGQVIFVYNRVQTIQTMYRKLQELVPEARIVVAHGQQSPRKLERTMLGFINYEYDVLLCTTIVETGMDIANANTLIVDNADRMGLSQLYQLRGRVGRSGTQGYAYFMYNKNKIISEIAEKRLKTIKEFTEFGSGFKIAMQDLEIRGSGNILGESQHGHLGEVGYEMYVDMLGKAIRKLSGEAVEDSVEATLDLDVEAYIPVDYIEDERDKIEMYKKIASVKDQEDAEELLDELKDRFSEPPSTVLVLILISRLKSLAEQLKIAELRQSGKEVHFYNRANQKIVTKRFAIANDAVFLESVINYLESMKN